MAVFESARDANIARMHEISVSRLSLLGARQMHRWVSLLGSLLLAFALLTGGAAHAAEKFDCVPVTAEAAGHLDGDGDESPSGGEQGAVHNHGGCSGHQFAAPDEGSDLVIGAAVGVVPFAWREAGVPARSPDSLLRPPIA